MEDWIAFGEWLWDLETTEQWPYAQLIRTFEEQTGITIRWADK